MRYFNVEITLSVWIFRWGNFPYEIFSNGEFARINTRENLRICEFDNINHRENCIESIFILSFTVFLSKVYQTRVHLFNSGWCVIADSSNFLHTVLSRRDALIFLDNLPNSSIISYFQCFCNIATNVFILVFSFVVRLMFWYPLLSLQLWRVIDWLFNYL